MGEAKRHNNVTITRAEKPTNYIIWIDEYEYDYAIRLEDAETIAQQLRDLLEKYPIENISPMKMMTWLIKHGWKTLHART